MRTRPLGKTGISISELTLGTWGLSGDGYGPVDPTERDRTVDRALELGIDAFDTADVYGRGAMETALGERLSAAGKKTYVITKIGTMRTPLGSAKRFEPKSLREAVAQCGERLRRPVLDFVLLHNPSMVTMTRGEAAETMKELVSAGTVGAWGVSAGTEEVGRAAMLAGAKVIELAYNVFFSRDLHHLAADLSIAGTAILARSTLAYGLLAGHFTKTRKFPEGDHRASRWSDDELATRVDQLDALRPFVVGEVPSLRAAALRFVLANELVSSAVIGPRSVPQLEQLVHEVGSGPPYLPESALSQLSAELQKVGINP